MARYISVPDTAKLIRAALKAAFPGTAFSVRSSSYSGGASIDIRWTDGPTTKQVEAISGRFQGATFDGMVDLMEYHESTLASEAVRFGADFVFCERKLSAPFLKAVAARECVDRGYAVPRIAESYGDAYFPDRDLLPRLCDWNYDTLGDAILRRAWTTPASDIR